MSSQNNDLPEGFKVTELGPLPEEWEIVRLKQVCEKIKAGGTPVRKEAKYWGGTIPFVLIEDMTSCNLYLTKTKRTITESGMQNSNCWLVPSNSLLLSMYATIGETAINTVPLATNQAILGIILKPQLNVEFAAMMLKFYANRLVAQNIQSTQRNVNKGIVENFSIALPPLPEQKAIAQVLSTFQRAIETQGKIIAATKELKKSLMRHLFKYGPVPVAEAENVPLKETEIGPVPEHWEMVRLGEVTEKPEYGYTATASSKIVGPKYLRITDIQNSVVDWASVPYCRCPSIDTDKYKLHYGDILFARIGATTGKTYLVEDCPSAVFASYLIRVRCKSSLLPAYLNQFTSTKNYWDQINALKGDRLKHGINTPNLKSLLIPFPSLPEQQEIARILSSVDSKIEAEENRKAALQTLFKTMLYQLMTGKVRVKDQEVTAA